MIDWYVICAVRYGKSPYGPDRSKRTEFWPTFLTERRIPLYEDWACESGLSSRLKVATTSSTVIRWPSWKRTPWRIWNVHERPPRLGAHLVARRGRRTFFVSEYVSCSPDIWVTLMAASVWSSGGSSEASMDAVPIRIVPPRRCAGSVAAVGLIVAPCAGPASKPRNGSEMPSTEPRWMSSRRVRLPARYSSIRSFSSSPAFLR